jgi:hypothetical protein
MVSVNARVVVAGGTKLSATWAVKLNVPAAVDVPLITPVAGFNSSPGGSPPALTDQV